MTSPVRTAYVHMQRPIAIISSTFKAITELCLKIALNSKETFHPVMPTNYILNWSLVKVGVWFVNRSNRRKHIETNGA